MGPRHGVPATLASGGAPRGDDRRDRADCGFAGEFAGSYSSEPPPSPQIPCVRSRMSTPGLSGGPGGWGLRSLTTRSRAANSSALLIPVAMISAAIESPTGPRVSATSSRDSSAIGTASLTWRHVLLGGSRLRLGLCLARGAPFLEPAHDHEERRHEQYGEASRGEH